MNTTTDESFSVPVTQDWEAFRACILRQGTPKRVHHIELFLDWEIQNAVAQRFHLLDDLDSDAGDFAWVIPTPSQVGQADVTEGNPRVFEELYRLTEPRAYVGGGRGMFGCSGNSGGTPQYAGVDVWEQFAVGDYDVAVLSAQDSSNLGAWLNDHGYEVGERAGGPRALRRQELVLRRSEDPRLRPGQPGRAAFSRVWRPRRQVRIQTPADQLRHRRDRLPHADLQRQQHR